MSWHAIVPFNYGRDRKTRLAGRLSADARDTLSLAMAGHVVATLARAPGVAAVTVVSPDRPPFADAGWIADGGRGLNAELAAARAGLGDPPVLYIHADLPGLSADDVVTLLAGAAEAGVAIAPDWADIGTNALAIRGLAGFLPCFGRDSFAAHRRALPDAAIIRRPGLSRDVDDPDSLDRAIADGVLAGLPAAHRSPDMR